MPRGLSQPVTIRRRRGSGESATYPDSVTTWARIEDGGTYEDSDGGSVYGITVRDFTVRFVPFLENLQAAEGSVGQFDLTKLEVVDIEGHAYIATNVVQLERRKFHRVTAGRRLYYKYIGS